MADYQAKKVRRTLKLAIYCLMVPAGVIAGSFAHTLTQVL